LNRRSKLALADEGLEAISPPTESIVLFGTTGATNVGVAVLDPCITMKGDCTACRVCRARGKILH